MSKKIHPNSLKNLRPMWDKESANEAREKGLETRRANKELREALKMTAAEIKLTAQALSEAGVGAVDRLRVIAAKYEEQGDIDSAVDIYKSIAEFEAPKLARVDQTTTEVGIEDLSEDELNEKIRRLLKDD